MTSQWDLDLLQKVSIGNSHHLELINALIFLKIKWDLFALFGGKIYGYDLQLYLTYMNVCALCAVMHVGHNLSIP